MPDSNELLIERLSKLLADAEAGRISWFSSRLETSMKKGSPSQLAILYRTGVADAVDVSRRVVVPNIEAILSRFKNGYLRATDLQNVMNANDATLVTLNVLFEAKGL